jgi:hypothetical protein
MFVSGYGYLWQNVELPEFAKERMRLSSDFSATPTEELASKLRQSGVDYFIVDKSLIENEQQYPDTDFLLSNERFSLIKLGR